IRKIQQIFPVFDDPAQGRHHEPIGHKQLKDLAESVRTYGTNASFTQAQVERLTAYAMTPADWYNTVKACLTMGQYLDWKSIYQDACAAQARQNAANGQPFWTYEMLTGQGQWTVNQTAYPVEVYGQINQIAVRAWKSLPNKGEVTGNLTKIVQGINEPFSDFVARIMEAAGRIFGDPDTAMPLIEQLVYEQCTKECRNAITPWKGKGLNAWMKACREIGGPLSNAGIAAAVLAAKRIRDITCYNCGKRGHIKRQCKSQIPGSQDRVNVQKKVPGMCPRCGKGKHWANECRLVKDIKGRVLTNDSNSQPKNRQRGPRPQGPQMYGAMNVEPPKVSMRPPGSHGEPLWVPQGWTSVPPPEQY
uniref:igE-binding protein-like n=1 Tax=Jaculus jaculus TaxID=51337 RepID=UPI001E1B598C